MKTGFPIARPGQTVGLLGGSFDPPHKGHVQISNAALKRFGLDHLWWLVSPGNPLKQHSPASMERRLKVARSLIGNPRIKVTDLEVDLGTRYTAETLRRLRVQYPGVRFVWLMGADNLTHFHRWKDWQDILRSVPVGVLARPGDRISARFSPAARIFAPYRLKGSASHLLARSQAPAWCFINLPMVDVSSSQIRAEGSWPKDTGV